MLAVAVPAIDTTLAITSTSAARTSQAVASQAANFAQKLKEFVVQKQEWVTSRLERTRQHVQQYAQKAFQFSQSIKMASAFFPIVVLAKIIIGFFKKPLEFIMLAVACLFLAVFYVLHFIFSIPPFDWVPFVFYFAVMHIIPLAVYGLFYGVLFAAASVVCLLISGVNYITGGSLKRLVLCQNSPAGWYKTPNYHLLNRYERGIMCSRPCAPGYAPDPMSKWTCQRLSSFQTPSYCPQAQITRSYFGDSSTANGYPRYADFGGWRGAHKSPEEKKQSLENHYMQKRRYLESCKAALNDYEFLPQSLCSSKDAIDGLPSKINQACSQTFCTTDKAYPFCADVTTVPIEPPKPDFWIIKLLQGTVHMLILGLIILVMIKVFSANR